MYEHFTSTVIHGKQLWRTLWFPTINCPIDQSVELLAATYRVNVLIAWTTYRGIWPWFPDYQLFEVHLLDTKDDFYTKEVTIIPLTKIRENIQFISMDVLKTQLQQDLQRAKEHPQTVITFGTFDYFHPGHEAYLREAKKYGDELITIVARDTTIKKIKWTYPIHNEQQRVSRLQQFDIISSVELGDADDPYRCLKKHRPACICLWYDQHSFDNWLRERCDTHDLSWTTILRLPSFSPEKWKSSYYRMQ